MLYSTLCTQMWTKTNKKNRFNSFASTISSCIRRLCLWCLTPNENLLSWRRIVHLIWLWSLGMGQRNSLPVCCHSQIESVWLPRDRWPRILALPFVFCWKFVDFRLEPSWFALLLLLVRRLSLAQIAQILQTCVEMDGFKLTKKDFLSQLFGGWF